MYRNGKIAIVLLIALSTGLASAQTIALWLFDEQQGLYPSCALADAGPNDMVMVLGPGGSMASGKFGNALSAVAQPRIDFPEDNSVSFGLRQIPVPEGRTIEPMSWMNANFAGLMTAGENHLRKEIRFKNAAESKLNLGDFDWTVEFWFKSDGGMDEGVIFEIGSGPRGENDLTTRLSVLPAKKIFRLKNADTEIDIPTAVNPKAGKWAHYAFVYSADENQLSHYVNGRRNKLPGSAEMQRLPAGDESYFTVGRDALWDNPLPGLIDELRLSEGRIYTKNFKPPGSLSPDQWPEPVLIKGPPLLFGKGHEKTKVVELGNRKHLFIDDAMIDKSGDITFTPNPPQFAGTAVDSIQGPFRKHLSVIEDGEGVIRLYYADEDDYWAVLTSRDGMHFEKPDLGYGEILGETHMVTTVPTGMGNVFIDPNAPPEARWKYLSGFQERGIHLFYSSDGFRFKRVMTAAVPIRAGSQSNMWYDEQRQSYVGYHRSDFYKTRGGKTERTFGILEVKDIMKPWPFDPVTQEETREAAKTKRLRNPQPWYLDNGPLTPGGLGIEFPRVFGPDDDLDPPETDVYVPKAIKYPWAPDTYVAFPLLYFHYDGELPLGRQVLMHPERLRGSGPVETQLSVSRDAIHWDRFPRPAYVGIGRFGKHDIHQSYFAHGMVRRGDEIWQYCFSERRYHSTWEDDDENVRAVYRFIQRLDGFVSVDTPYDREGWMITRPFTFKGSRLQLNIDTDATGYAQVGFLDEAGDPIEGFDVDQCVYINGDFIRTEVEWIKNPEVITIPYGDGIDDHLEEAKKLRYSTDISSLAGKTVRLKFRMRGAKLYAMQFIN